ncbi:hypothetical protein ES319_A01G114800v1 [Gossypium barbadense]|uniref:Uncharacterized protein n=1 Tax=Gossypium barbadense TaxID=3634 RepID=A0A5J5WYN7_GOSBA|nr:hypothetical protein ES319_A01G114800v1 [Gossypium barbadense]
MPCSRTPNHRLVSIIAKQARIRRHQTQVRSPLASYGGAGMAYEGRVLVLGYWVWRGCWRRGGWDRLRR